MASQSRRTDPPLEEVLFEEGYRFAFFEAVRVLERVFPERPPVGRDGPPSGEVVRFRSRLSLSFPPSEIHEMSRGNNESEPAQMTVAFMGLTGPSGVLPRHYTEMLIERVRQKDLALRDFLDLFNHRFISLFYRAWEKYRFPIGYERAVSKGGYDPFSLYLFDLIGMGTKGLRGKLEVDEEALLFYAGLFAQQPRSASALESTLKDYLGAPTKIAQFTGEWLQLSEESLSRLESGEGNNVLGQGAVAGSRVWDHQARFRIRIGPLTFEEFSQFLPSGSAFRSLVQLTRLFIGLELDFDIQLVLKAAGIPNCRLGGQEKWTPQLGWSSWLKSRDFTHDGDDALLGSHLTRIEGSSSFEKLSWEGGAQHER